MMKFREALTMAAVFISLSGVVFANQDFAEPNSKGMYSFPITNNNEPNEISIFNGDNFSVELPYNKEWEVNNLRIRPYDSINTNILFGALRGCAAGATCRDFSLEIKDSIEWHKEKIIQYWLLKREKDTLNSINYFEKKLGNYDLIEITINDVCEYKIWEILGTNHTYSLSACLNDAVQNQYENIVRSIKEAKLHDISRSHSNFIAITYVADHHIVSGYPDGTYRPDSPINRAEFTKIVVNATTQDSSTIRGSTCFPDVQKEWFAPFVCTAKANNTINGYPDGTFKPAENVNFVEAAKIVVNAFGLETGEETDTWYENDVNALEAVNAIPLSITSLDQKITRGEMAEIIYRIHAKIQDLPSQSYEIYY
jgi:hypothetical protein